MVTCTSTLILGLAFLVFGALGFGVFMRNIKVGSIAGGLGAVIIILSLFGIGC